MKNNRNYIRKDNKQSKEITINDGLQQGGMSSPT